MELTKTDLHNVLTHLPKDVRELLTENKGHLVVGGGFIRAQIAGEVPSDIDLSGSSRENLDHIAKAFCAKRGDTTKIWRTKNAITVITPGRLPVQFITRWVYDDPCNMIESFDFTVCQAAIWMSATGVWQSVVGDRFYVDLAARRLTYTSPQREEEVGGSMMRVLKYLKRGYSIQAPSLAKVIARLTTAVRDNELSKTEHGTAQIITGLLREVDPLAVIDGVEVIEDDHAPVEQA